MAVYRAYPQLFAVRVRESATRVGELRPSLTQFGVEISTGDAKRRLESVDYAELVWVQSLLSEIQDRTFQEMMSEFKLQTGCSLEQFREEMKTLGLAHELVIHPRIDDVKFYVSTCNAAVTHDNRGVLLADAGHAGRRTEGNSGLEQAYCRARAQVDGLRAGVTPADDE